MWLLVNQDCVVFYNYLNDLRSNDVSESFSIFKYCDEETSQLIDKLSKLSKDRIMSLKLKIKAQADEDDQEDEEEEENKEDEKSKKKQNKKKPILET